MGDRDKADPMWMIYSVTNTAMRKSLGLDLKAKQHILIFHFRMFLQRKEENQDGEEAIPLSSSSGWQMYSGLLLLSVFLLQPRSRATCLFCHKYTASNVRPDLLYPLEREQSKSVFEPNNDNKQQWLFANSPDQELNREGAVYAVNQNSYYPTSFYY